MGFVSDNKQGILAMHNSKSSGGGGRLNPRKMWSRARSKSQPRTSSGNNSFGSWESLGNGAWITSGRHQVVLSDTTLFNLSEVELNALRQLALAKLQAMDLGCNICMPKTQDNLGSEKRKRKTLGLKKRALTTGFFENNGKSKSEVTSDNPQSPGMVFGIPLAKCIQNDRANRRSTSTTPLRDVANLLNSSLIIGSASAEDITNERLLSTGRSFCGSQSSCNIPLDVPVDKRFFQNDNEESFESLKLAGKSYSMSGLCFIDSMQDWPNSSEGDDPPHIPHIVNTCFNHLETNGLHRLGLFRISSSKKRVKQLRDDFDNGKEVDLSRDYCPHDVATLLKEYFRDLPEPLLTRELYSAFVGSQRIRNRRQQLDCLSYLIQLLPVPSRDTLWALLRFLYKVASNSMDHRAETGEWVTGNKMDSHNLATLFGPNILHMAKPNLFQGSEFQVESSKRAEERCEVIKVVRTMIDNYKELFEVSAFSLDELYHRLQLQNPELLARLLLAKLAPTEYDTYKFEVNPDTGSSACSETTSISHLPIDVSMELASSLLIGMPGENFPDQEVVLGKHLERGSSSESIASGKRPERGGSLGRDIYNKAEMVTSRLFRRRGKSSTREDPKECGVGCEEVSHQWFRKKGEKKSKRDKSQTRKREQSESDGSGSSDHKSSSRRIVDAPRPLLMQERSSSSRLQHSQTTNNFNPSVTQLMTVMDIRKEHLHVPEVFEKRSNHPDAGKPEVISASLTLKVPLARSKTGPAIAFGQGIDIPFIEDEHREARRFVEKYIRKPSFPNEDEKIVATKATVTAPQLRAKSRFADKMSPLSTSASTSAIPSPPIRHHRETHPSSKQVTSVYPSRQQTAQSYTVASGNGQRQRSRTKNSEPSNDVNNHPTSNTQWPQETWKRWEIISSEHTEQETVV